MSTTLTVADVREIAETVGFDHARFVVEQHTTQIGRPAAEPLWAALARLADEEDAAHATSCADIRIEDYDL